ncbi:hypothetical protein APR41_04035 [Salegentibacter salinarum]|uniref:Amidohydrolase n=1 Tax=Salegentibacter salinarum TaxID=447422 RepID=A0A2N0TUB4_9FLAO|nr:amidohydrolase [Salegentibacter salinarum]PKD18330.1 hypothetical protein APR41_04035 [Salegentibacter salinarum]SKB44079.1 amidohydrolase [Salegentibacter salinarum]
MTSIQQNIKFLFLVIMLSNFGYSQEKQVIPSIHQSIQSQTDNIFESLVEIRRDLHKYPEISGEEKRTAGKINEYLLSLGLEVKKGIGGNGVVGILKGAKKGRHIAWRADIDAMSSDIPDVVEFKSENPGIRHICGHDVHTTIAMGIANVLNSQRENLKGTVYFIFQPAEETYRGAKAMINDGLFEIINPEEIYGLHITPSPAGVVSTKENNVYAHRTKIEVVYQSTNQNTAALDYTKGLISNLQTYGKESEFWEDKNLMDPDLGLANRNTIYSNYIAVKSDYYIKETEDKLKISAIVDASEKDLLEKFKTTIKNVINESKFSENLLAVKFNFSKEMPIKDTPMNDKELATATMNSLAEIYGENVIVPVYGVTSGQMADDFAYFQEEVPGVYFFLGGSKYEKGIIAMPHTPNFAVDEESMRAGVKYFSSMIVERLLD